MFPNLLEQLKVFRVVADCQSFTEAAKKLNKTPSAISYTIATLEKHLQLPLFDRSSYRPTLTEHGVSVYEDADLIQRRVDRFQARVGLMTDGAQADVELAVDTLFPRNVIVDALEIFSREYPHVAVRLRFSDPETATGAVRDNACDLGVISVDSRVTFTDIDAIQIGSTQNVLVAAPDHPLARMPEGFRMTALEDHRQIFHVLRSTHRGGQNYIVHRTDVWTAGSTDMQIELVRRGLGWAYIHHSFIWQDLRDGTLVKLNCQDISDWNRPRFAVVWRVATSLKGPIKRMSELLNDCFPSAYPPGFDEDFNQWGAESET